MKVLALLALWAFSLSLQAEFSARVDRTVISENDTLELTLTLTGGGQAEPVLSVLTQDFDVLGTSSGSQFSNINGKTTSKRIWRIGLLPERLGDLQIPPIKAGKYQSQAIAIKVLKEKQVSGLPRLHLEMSVDKQSAPVQSQLVVTIRLYYRINLLGGELSALKVGDSVAMQLGDDRAYDTQLEGQPFRVLERRYALFPQRSGKLVIPAVGFTGQQEVSTKRRSSGVLSLYRTPQGKRIRARSKPLEIDVLPPVAGPDGAVWLPAKSLIITENWSAEEVEVGEPATRTLQISTRGLSAAQLPELPVGLPDGAKIYPDKAQVEDKVVDGDVVSVRSQKWAVVAQREGELEFPEIRLPWWNVEAGEWQTATLPARTLRVIPSAQQVPVPSRVEPRESVTVAETRHVPEVQGGRQGFRAAWYQNAVWPILSLFFLTVWLFTLWYYRRKSGTVHAAVSAGVPETGRTDALKTLKKACLSGDASAARAALESWARANKAGDASLSLASLGGWLGMTQEMTAFQQALYASPAPEWDGKAFWEAFRRASKKRQKRASRAAQLPDLYPQKTRM